MCQPSWPIVLTIVSALLAGCATSSIEMAPDQPDRPWAPATNAAGEIIPGAKPSPEQAGGGTYVLPANSELAEVPSPFGLDRTRTYSLAELIDIAQSNNPLTRTAWNNARNVALAAGIAKSTYLPRLTAAAIGGFQISQISGPLRTTATNELRGTISLVSFEWLLFDFGQRAAVVEAANQASVISNIGFTAAHQQLIYDVSLAFYANAAARARVGNAVQSLKNAESVQAAAEDRMKRGMGTAIEAAQARQATAQARLVMIQATGAAQNGYLTLISAMGISPLTYIKVADVSDRRLSPELAGSAKKVISVALARRPDILAAYAAQKASLANVRAAEAEFLPKVFLSGTGSYNNGTLSVTGIPSVGNLSSITNLSGNHFGGIVFAGVTVPVFDGGTRAAILEQAQAKADNAGLALTRTRDETVRQIVLANNALRTSLSSYNAATAVVSAAKTTFDAALAAYRSGVGSITDTTMAETQLLQARNASTDAYSTALSAAATLGLSTGSLGAPLQ
jgi:outer membrane protein